MIQKLLLSIAVILVVYFWNKIIVKQFLVGGIIKYYKNNNSDNLNKQPIKFFINNENKIVNITSLVYWFGAIMILYGIWISK